jgi:hypothetical protein
MPARKKLDDGTMKGIGRSLHSAFAPDSPVDPELRRLIRDADGVYTPDEMSDQRVDQLLQRLRNLDWDTPKTFQNGGGTHV